jgi:hypothetical protein
MELILVNENRGAVDVRVGVIGAGFSFVRDITSVPSLQALELVIEVDVIKSCDEPIVVLVSTRPIFSSIECYSMIRYVLSYMSPFPSIQL